MRTEPRRRDVSPDKGKEKWKFRYELKGGWDKISVVEGRDGEGTSEGGDQR